MTPSPAWYAEMNAKLFRIADRLLRYHEDRLRPPEEVLDNPLGIALLREASGIMALWAVCENSACRRARSCRRPPFHCIKHYAPLLPPEARAGVTALLRERHHLRSFPRKRESR